MIHQGSDKDLVLKPDVCIVGSGAGGAMVASRLTRAGAKVLVLEEGITNAFDPKLSPKKR